MICSLVPPVITGKICLKSPPNKIGLPPNGFSCSVLFGFDKISRKICLMLQNSVYYTLEFHPK
ncbi:hypothetical protein RchiOBHm_Chr5g0053331 [Rosa chinensis]|uniref:Uncharacterized protein n=1 Tax=Rosa chinensis TaxID=74649 RepID=A0A2P6QFW9_ROSCH|nr:hypothetical protein RchiOBHm_Chr5g0053331 [Rosa chinensis]